MGDKDGPPAHMNGWEKRNVVEDTLKTGDAPKAQSVLNTVEDQKLFMDLLASKARDDSGLHKLQITDGKDGAPISIKTDKLVVTREDGPDGEKLSAHGVGVGSTISEAWNKTEDSIKAKFKPLTDFTDEWSEAWHNKGTSKSVTNQRIDRQIKDAEGEVTQPKAPTTPPPV